MAALGVLIAGGITRFLTDRVTYFFAMKALLVTLFVTVLPLVLQSVITWLAEIIYVTVISAISDYSFTAQVINFGGVAGYLATQLQLPLCISIVLSALSVRMILNFIPFFK